MYKHTTFVVDSDVDYTSDSNIIPYDQYVEDNEEHVVQCNASSVRNDALMSILDEMHEQGGQSAQTVHMLCQPKSFYDEKHKVAIGYKKQAQSAVYNGHMPVTTNHTPTVIHDSEDTREIAEITRKRMLLKMQSPLCVENKIRISPPDYSKENLLATFAPQRNLTPEQIFWEAPDFERSFFKIKNLEHQIQEKDNVIGHLKDLVTNVNDRSREPHSAVDVTALIEQNNCDRLELEKVKQHYKELFDSIKILRTHTSEKTSTMLNEIESLKAQLRSKAPCFTSNYVKPKVLAPGMYAIDVKPIPHPLKNNRSAHLNYIGHLKESVETVREIVEEARAVKPLDSSLNYACRYTKLSQELLECVLGTCPKNFNKRDNKAPSTPVTGKKQVTFSDKPGTSSSNTQKHKMHQRVQLTNIPVLPSTGVNDSTEASGSKPRSNTKKNRILPAKKENKKEVEVRHRTNRSVWTKVNRVDSSISSKRVVINSNSESVNSASNGMCVVNVLNSVNATPTIRIVLHKDKQIWKPKGKLSDNSFNKTKQIWKPKGKLSDNSLNKTKQIWKPKSKLSDNSLSKTQRVWSYRDNYVQKLVIMEDPRKRNSP
ncbi:hypothetical protein Tco_1369690 [Tanacetum coccineum]